MQDWRDVWRRELEEAPPADVLIAGFLGYEGPSSDGPDDITPLIEETLPDVEE